MLIGLLLGLCVNMAVLLLWVLQPPIYLILTRYRCWLKDCVFPTLRSRLATSATGLVFIGFLWTWAAATFCSAFATPPTHTYGLRSLANDSLLFSSSIQFTFLGLFRRSFVEYLGCDFSGATVEGS